MNLTQHKLDEISYKTAIISDKIYRKINNLDNTYSVYRLDFRNDGFVWEKIYNFMLPEGHECISFDDLVYHKGAVQPELNEANNCITIYMCPRDGIATKEMIYKGDNLLIWNMFIRDMELDPSLNTNSLLNLPIHVDLIQESFHISENEECQADNYDFLDEFEPLNGWDNLLERSSDINDESIKGENILLSENIGDNDLEIKDITNYPDEGLALEGLAPEGLAPEGLALEGLAPEGLALEGLPLEGLAPEGLPPEGLPPDNTNTKLNEEYRVDPYDGELYSKSEFIEYYGGETEWNHQSPKNILLREEYYKFADTFSHLSNKKFIYLFKKYEKTFSQ
jgi:hypothetical protein